MMEKLAQAGEGGECTPAPVSRHRRQISLVLLIPTGGKFATGVNETGGKSAAGVNDTGGK